MEEKSNYYLLGHSLFTGALTIVFVVLKLCKVINWSWWWVLSPIWIAALAELIVIGIFALVLAIQDRRG